MKLLITGGAGYIGSHMAKIATLAGHEVVVLDDLSTGHAEQVKYGRLVIGRTHDTQRLRELFIAEQFDAVLHFAAFSIVAESVNVPAKYHDNNVVGTERLLQVMAEYQVRHIVFSSTAAVYGEPAVSPIQETAPLSPVNPYGASKAAVEDMLREQCAKRTLSAISLRYFNACGADPDAELGERHDPETHLIPLAIQAALGQRKDIAIYGDDYQTKDGTCVRDYVHVQDLCEAHLLALRALTKQARGYYQAFNLGSEGGYSVLDIVNAVKYKAKREGYDLKVRFAPRREGDPAVLIADSQAAREQLGWRPVLSDLESIIEHTWAFSVRMQFK